MIPCPLGGMASTDLSQGSLPLDLLCPTLQTLATWGYLNVP